MTCFWDSILSCLTIEDFKLLGSDRKLKREELILSLKNKNCLTDTLWQGNKLREQEKKEHFEAVKCYNIKGIYKGHLTSICDSFLLLLCHVLKLNINHRYLNTNINYRIEGARKTLSFKSNRGHFSR
uniref:Uncharacterized protein n=1 Tax=viral metagenome TaxID=1070528 RepID=A0A6C0CSR3_9ZZZZ